MNDGPGSSNFKPVKLQGNTTLAGLRRAKVSKQLRDRLPTAPSGKCVGWGVSFSVDRIVLLKDEAVTTSMRGLKAPWLVFMHTADVVAPRYNKHGFISPTTGEGRLNEHVADYVICYADGSEVVAPIRRRHHLGMIARGWGENCFQCVPQIKPAPVLPVHEQPWTEWGKDAPKEWGWSQTRATNRDYAFDDWMNWLYAWENPHPRKAIKAIRFEPKAGTVIVSGISAGKASSNPLRWETRRKAVFKLPKDTAFDYDIDHNGLFKQMRLDLGQIISAQPRKIYPNRNWADTYNNKVPKISETEVHIEYSAHEDAVFHLPKGKTVAASKLRNAKKAAGPLTPVAPSTQRVKVRVLERDSKQPVPVKFHAHGVAGEYLAPVDRHRIPNPAWFEDYGGEYLNEDIHNCTYINGETVVDLPLGKVYLEVSKGLEIKPIRKVVNISKGTKQITLTVNKVLPWRERGWVTADTHVHFLSPATAMLEGSAEGVNVINLLASQWGELMTNAADFDGKTTFGSKEAGGDGEWLVRVGSENRQHVMGHISLIGYSGELIAPMCSGGSDEAAIGDPLGVLMAEWAQQCKAQGGLVVMPHFPNPRAENAANMVAGDIDAVEMCSWGNHYAGLNPYSLSDYYRYLNCGYFYPCVGGTDKMSANTSVGTIRTYTKIPRNKGFDFENWMSATRKGNTFVTYGPLMEFEVDGKAPGTPLKMSANGGTVDVTYELASVTMPMSRVELVVNGEIRESKKIGPRSASGSWSVKLDRSSWLALMVRGHYKDKPEVIAAHSSPVMAQVNDSPFFAAADALTILEQIEGALAYLDTIGTRAETTRYKKMRMVLTNAHRELHNRMHAEGVYHEHTHATDHPEHHH
jgi:hypothetical protein